jgi:hypothetical protein
MRRHALAARAVRHREHYGERTAPKKNAQLISIESPDAFESEACLAPRHDGAQNAAAVNKERENAALYCTNAARTGVWSFGRAGVNGLYQASATTSTARGERVLQRLQ